MTRALVSPPLCPSLDLVLTTRSRIFRKQLLRGSCRDPNPLPEGDCAAEGMMANTREPSPPLSCCTRRTTPTAHRAKEAERPDSLAGLRPPPNSNCRCCLFPPDFCWAAGIARRTLAASLSSRGCVYVYVRLLSSTPAHACVQLGNDKHRDSSHPLSPPPPSSGQ